MEKNYELELLEEEVNVYKDNCGQTRYDCLHDCFGINAMLSSDN